MSNKQIIKEAFTQAFDQKQMHDEILNKYERKKEKNVGKILKYAIMPLCLILIVSLGIFLKKGDSILESSNVGTMKVYAYTTGDNKQTEKRELKENVQLGLSRYNLAMSSVPGYPIEFELKNLDYIMINVTNGEMFTWDNSEDGTGKIDVLENNHKLTKNGALYFKVNENTVINIKAFKNNKEMFAKKITISSDDHFNYYALIK